MSLVDLGQLRSLLREEVQAVGKEQIGQIVFRLDETCKSLIELHSLMHASIVAQGEVPQKVGAVNAPSTCTTRPNEASVGNPMHGLSRIAMLLKEEEADLEDLDKHEQAHARSSIRHVRFDDDVDVCGLRDRADSDSSSQHSFTASTGESSLEEALLEVPQEVNDEERKSSKGSKSSGRKGSKSSRHRSRSCYRIAESPAFIKMIGTAILINSIMIGVEVQYAATHLNEKVPIAFYASEVFFCALFVGDIVLRLLGSGCAFFYSKDWAWNVFDFVVVSLQLLENVFSVSTRLFSDKSVLNFAEQSDSISLLNMLRIIRLMRILRLARLIKMVGELKEIVVAITSCMRALGWTVGLLMFLIYMLGVALTQAVSDHFEGVSLAHQVEAREFFGSVDASMLSLFQCITDGKEWRDVFEALREVSPILCLCFLLYIMFAAFALLNMLTGIIVENALESGKHHRRHFLLQEVRAVFAGEEGQNDKTKITWEDFAAHLKDPHLIHVLEAIDICEDTAHDLFELLDTEEEGAIDVDEFVNGCIALHGNAKAFDLAQLMHESRIHTKKWIHESQFVNTALGEISNALIGLGKTVIPDAQSQLPVGYCRSIEA